MRSSFENTLPPARVANKSLGVWKWMLVHIQYLIQGDFVVSTDPQASGFLGDNDNR